MSPISMSESHSTSTSFPRPKVFIAGPYRGGDVGANVALAMDVWHELHAAGFDPFCPHLSHYLHIHHGLDHEVWLAWTLAWVESCDAAYRLPGESEGADNECARMRKLERPVFTEMIEARRWIPSWLAAHHG